MTGTELWGLKEGDLLRLNENMLVRKSTWLKGDLVKVEYRLHGDAVDTIIVRNITKYDAKKTPNVASFSPLNMLESFNLIPLETSNMITTEIKHKLNAGDTAWVMYMNKPTQFLVNYLTVKIDKDSYSVCYQTYSDGHMAVYDEKNVFATK